MGNISMRMKHVLAILFIGAVALVVMASGPFDDDAMVQYAAQQTHRSIAEIRQGKLLFDTQWALQFERAYRRPPMFFDWWLSSSERWQAYMSTVQVDATYDAAQPETDKGVYGDAAQIARPSADPYPAPLYCPPDCPYPIIPPAPTHDWSYLMTPHLPPPMPRITQTP